VINKAPYQGYRPPARRHVHRDCNHDAANTMTVMVEPTPTVRAGADGWFIGGRMPNAKSIGWAIYAAGFAIWLFGYLSTGHASAFDWDFATPWWISSFVPNREAELGLALTFGSMVPIYWRTILGWWQRRPISTRE
jgi:hypothetical protein